MKAKTKFLTYHSPHNPDRLILTDAKGRFVATLDRQTAFCRADADRARAELGAARKEEAARLAPIVARATPVIQARAQMHRHNLQVLDNQPITPAEIQSAQDLRAHYKAHGKQAIADALGCNDPLPPSAEDARAASALECGERVR
jgi:hypothetical protein